MNKHKPARKAKARHLCFVLLLSVHLAWGGVPGPCRHSVTKDHLFHLNRLIDNQLENGCPISYLFTEHQSLSKVCYIKAAFPQILELLNTHFQYGKRSDNRRYVNALKKVIYDIYSQRCIPEINEEIEDSPVKFLRVQNTSPKEALRKAKLVIQMYMSVMKESKVPVDWNCEEEYAEDYSESTTDLPILTTEGGQVCHCTCPILAQMTPDKATSSVWSRPPRTTLSRPTFNTSPRPSHTSQSTNSVRGHSSTRRLEQILLDRRSVDGDRTTETEMSRYPPVTGAKYDSAGSTEEKFLVSGMKNNITPAPFLYDVLAPISDDNTLYVLAKRSLDSRNYGIQQVSTDSSLPQLSKPHPQTTDTGVRYMGKSDYRNNPIGSITTEEEVQSVFEAEDTDGSPLLWPSQDLPKTETHRSGKSMSYKTGFIIAAVCAGLLLITTLQCFRAKRRHQALQTSRFQNHRAHANTKGIELQCFETKE